VGRNFYTGGVAKRNQSRPSRHHGGGMGGRLEGETLQLEHKRGGAFSKGPEGVSGTKVLSRFKKGRA